MASRWVLGGFAVLLIAVGVLGFLPAGGSGNTSHAPAYNVFHLAFGVAGLAFAVWGGPSATRAFLVGFGLIDLYQALASHRHWLPEASFRWTPTDDLLHLVIGALLIAAGALLCVHLTRRARVSGNECASALHVPVRDVRGVTARAAAIRPTRPASTR